MLRIWENLTLELKSKFSITSRWSNIIFGPFLTKKEFSPRLHFKKKKKKKTCQQKFCVFACSASLNINYEHLHNRTKFAWKWFYDSMYLILKSFSIYSPSDSRYKKGRSHKKFGKFGSWMEYSEYEQQLSKVWDGQMQQEQKLEKLRKVSWQRETIYPVTRYTNSSIHILK